MIVCTTFQSSEEARSLTRLLLDERLIAAGQIKTHEAFYWWDGQQFEEAEWQLTCLTRADLFRDLEKTILDNHSFDVPEIIGLPLTAVSDSFAGWIDEYTTPE